VATDKRATYQQINWQHTKRETGNVPVLMTSPRDIKGVVLILNQMAKTNNFDKLMLKIRKQSRGFCCCKATKQFFIYEYGFISVPNKKIVWDSLKLKLPAESMTTTPQRLLVSTLRDRIGVCYA